MGSGLYKFYNYKIHHHKSSRHKNKGKNFNKKINTGAMNEEESSMCHLLNIPEE